MNVLNIRLLKNSILMNQTTTTVSSISNSKTVVPDAQSELGKKEQVKQMFDNISFRYDFLNRFLSLGIDILWRKKAIKSLKPFNPKIILDVATGTGDLAIEALKLNPDKVIGVDISEGMLEMGRKKLAALKEKRIELQTGDSESLNFDDNTFDAATVAFGVRNFENLSKGLTDMLRVLKSGAPIAILEFSKPSVFPVKQVFQFYFKVILPFTGKFFSKDQRAYTYLPESVQHFPEGKAFVDIMVSCGYKNVSSHRLSFGICTLYTAVK